MNPREKFEDDDEERRELVHSAQMRPMDGPEAVAHLLAQSNRESQANRAQARELIKALEGVQRSQEYLGVALREEKRRSRWLLALVVLAPIVAGAAAFWMAGRVDDVRADVSDRLAKLTAEEQSARAEAEKGVRDARIVELSADVAGLRADLDASRSSLAEQQKHVAEREAALTAAEGRSDSARTEIGALEFEVRAARAKASAEQARSAHLEKRLGEMQAQLAAREEPAAAPKTEAPRATSASDGGAAAVSAEKPNAAPPAAAALPSDPAETEKTRVSLNKLLGAADDVVRYEIQSLAAAAGKSLTGLLVVGTDQRGAVVRTIKAARAEVAIDGATGTIVLRFFEGKLVVGAVEAPFFDGTYGVVVRGDASRWKSSGLDCVGTQ